MLSEQRTEEKIGQFDVTNVNESAAETNSMYGNKEFCVLHIQSNTTIFFT